MKVVFLKMRQDIEQSLIKAGLKKEGEYIGEVMYKGKFEDELCYCIDKETYDTLYL